MCFMFKNIIIFHLCDYFLQLVFLLVFKSASCYSSNNKCLSHLLVQAFNQCSNINCTDFGAFLIYRFLWLHSPNIFLGYSRLDLVF